MSGWEAAYGLLVVQVTLLSVMAGTAYLVIARRHPATAKRSLGVSVLLLLGLTVAAGLPLPEFWSLHVWPKETDAAPSLEPPSAGRNPNDQETETLIGMPDVSWTSHAEPASGLAGPPDISGPAASSPTTVIFRWKLLLELFLLIGGIIVGSRLLWGLWSTHRVLANSRRIDDAALVALATEIRRSIGCRPVELRVSTEIAGAATVGWRRPVLIFSADWQQWSEQELRAVVAHEMMHVRSNDYLAGLVARLTMVLYFYHPLVRWLGTRYFLAQEAVADAAAARFVGGRANYLAALSRIALRQDRQIRRLPVLAFGTSLTTFLMRRIEMLEIRDDRRSPMLRFLQWTTLACLCLGAVAVSALRSPAEDTKAESEGSALAEREEATSSTDGNAGSMAQGESPKSEELPPLPRSVTYKVTNEFHGVSRQSYQVMNLGPERSRQELQDGAISISNRGTSVVLIPKKKQAYITAHPEKDDEQLGLFEGFRKLLTDPRYKPEVKREVLGESEIDGRRVIGHRIISYGGITSIWVDPKSLLPVQVEYVTRHHPNMKRIQTDFAFNVELDESLFSVEPPADYTVYRRRAKSEPYEEKDLIETFRQCREYGEGTFPDTLDDHSLMRLTRKTVRALGEEPTAKQFDEYCDWSAKVSRGFTFVFRLPPEVDAHYAGTGVKVDATGTPVFWYKPEGKRKYRVIRADLSVIETDTPPEIPGARSMSEWGQEEFASRRPWRKSSSAYTVQNLAPLVRRMGIVPNSPRNELKVRVLPGSAAEDAGIRTGDRITALSGLKVERIENVAALWALLPYYAKLKPTLLDDGVDLTILRDGKQIEVKLASDVLRRFLSPSAQNGDDVQEWLAMFRQIGFEPDSDIPALSSVLKVRVLPGSAAEKAGIRSGDRITALNDDKVKRLQDVVNLLAWVQVDDQTQQSLADEEVRVTVSRDGSQVEVKLPGNVVVAALRSSDQEVR